MVRIHSNVSKAEQTNLAERNWFVLDETLRAATITGSDSAVRLTVLPSKVVGKP